MNQPATPIEAAADALLQVIVRGDLERRQAPNLGAIPAGPPSWHDATVIPHYGELDLPGLTTDPISTACRAELRRIGDAIYAAGGSDALGAAMISVAKMDLTNAEWRTIILKSVWAGIGVSVS
ncbi:hypothetical protein MKK69_01160 [Methylobacterium sp. J-026]|uniref:hypothetical protein n=1 Tax=Methylobacterium sp. J-026 TaxID=2836624 RepID=UPI001FB87F8D|nr:hypothetical protein [Methylobacterium sp. J-026]MCJ2132689.1 hypothetical protein [Methylobacterium sp. J-026]